jgi:hypothetical protein
MHILQRRRFSICKSHSKNMMKLKKHTGIRKRNPREELLDDDLIRRAVWECLKAGDSEGVIEVTRIYLKAVSKTEKSKRPAI